MVFQKIISKLMFDYFRFICQKACKKWFGLFFLKKITFMFSSNLFIGKVCLKTKQINSEFILIKITSTVY